MISKPLFKLGKNHWERICVINNFLMKKKQTHIKHHIKVLFREKGSVVGHVESSTWSLAVMDHIGQVFTRFTMTWKQKTVLKDSVRIHVGNFYCIKQRCFIVTKVRCSKRKGRRWEKYIRKQVVLMYLLHHPQKESNPPLPLPLLSHYHQFTWVTPVRSWQNCDSCALSCGLQYSWNSDTWRTYFRWMKRQRFKIYCYWWIKNSVVVRASTWLVCTRKWVYKRTENSEFNFLVPWWWQNDYS